MWQSGILAFELSFSDMNYSRPRRNVVVLPYFNGTCNAAGRQGHKNSEENLIHRLETDDHRPNVEVAKLAQIVWDFRYRARYAHHYFHRFRRIDGQIRDREWQRARYPLPQVSRQDGGTNLEMSVRRRTAHRWD